MIAAAYTRKSNDEGQKSAELKSTQLQLDEIRAFATLRGWTLDNRYIWSDDAVSGAEFIRRPGLRAMLDALDPKPPFQVLIVTEPSRLGRDTIRTLGVVQELEEAGVEVWASAKGRQVEHDDIGTIVESWANSQERVKVIERVVRALDARFEKRLVAGGRVYGYTSERVVGVDKAVRRVVNGAEAAVVREAFELAAKGWGCTRIAKSFQSRGIKSPARITELGRAKRERKNQERIEEGKEPLPPIKEAWTNDGLYELLHRDLYRGVVVRGRMKRGVGRGGKKIRTAVPESQWKRQVDESLRIVSDELWSAAHATMAARSATFLKVHNKLVGRPESFRGRHLLSNIAKCAVCGGALHAVTRGRNLRLSYVCKSNRVSGACLNASAVPAAELHAAVIRSLKATYTAESFEQYLASKATDQKEIDARHAELIHLVNVVIPGLAVREDRLLEAIEEGMIDKERAKKRSTEIREEREQAEARRDELESWVRNEEVDREQSDELVARWAEWSEALEDDAVLARQVLGKALAGAPIYAQPGAERRTWFYLGLASFEGILRGAVRPGAIATFVQDDEDPAPVVDRGVAPQAVREFLAVQAGFLGRGLPVKDGRIDWGAAKAVPAWALSRADKGRGIKPISGGSDAPISECSDATVTSGPPIKRESSVAPWARRAPART